MTAMDREHLYNTELTKLRHTNYIRHSRAIILLWAIFVVISVILNIVVFLQPQWIGDVGESAVAGYFGAWEYCMEPAPGLDYTCSGDFLVWDSILSDAFKATSLMVGLSIILLMTCMACFVLFCLLHTATVLKVCASFQVLAGVLMLLACIVYPTGWDHPSVRVICGQQADQFELGSCGIRWGYVLAIVMVLDAFILAILAMVLAKGQTNLMPEEARTEKEPIKN